MKYFVNDHLGRRRRFGEARPLWGRAKHRLYERSHASLFAATCRILAHESKLITFQNGQWSCFQLASTVVEHRQSGRLLDVKVTTIGTFDEIAAAASGTEWASVTMTGGCVRWRQAVRSVRRPSATSGGCSPDTAPRGQMVSPAFPSFSRYDSAGSDGTSSTRETRLRPSCFARYSAASTNAIVSSMLVSNTVLPIP